MEIVCGRVVGGWGGGGGGGWLGNYYEDALNGRSHRGATSLLLLSGHVAGWGLVHFKRGQSLVT